MISYCVCLSRPSQGLMLLRELREKTAVPYEILVWMNTADQRLVDTIETMQAEQVPIKVVGSTPADIGMIGYRILFEHAKYDMVAQVDEHVILLSKGIAEKAGSIFKKHKDVKMLVADVIQDKYTDGARPPMDQYREMDGANGLYDGPVDGWFAIYDREFVPALYDAPYERYFYLGSWARGKAISMKLKGALCTEIRVFHAYGPAYGECFGSRIEEANRFMLFGKKDLADLYNGCNVNPDQVREMKLRVSQVSSEFEES